MTPFKNSTYKLKAYKVCRIIPAALLAENWISFFINFCTKSIFTTAHLHILLKSIELGMGALAQMTHKYSEKIQMFSNQNTKTVEGLGNL